MKEKTRLVSSLHIMSMFLKPGEIDECGRNQTSQQVTMAPVTLTESSKLESHTRSDITVTLENESVWNRFHSLGTEMILTKQGRRMFPCCRFRLSGLDQQRKYFLVMDIMPLNDFTHKWNGKTWERVAVDEPHVQGQVCIHPESPALGQQWMDSPVSFYKVKLSSESVDQDGCVLLRPMHRYLPRLHVVPVDPEGTIALDSPNVKKFSFPQTEFYAVTSYQNPQITQLKIDCNPFAMAFRDDSKSFNLLQNRLRLNSSTGKPFQSPLQSLAWNLSGKPKEGTKESTASTCFQKNRVRGVSTRSASLKKGEGILTTMRNNMALCQDNTDYTENAEGNEAVVNQNPAETVWDEHLGSLDFEPSVTMALVDPLSSSEEPVPLISSTEKPKSCEDADNSSVRCTNSESPIQSSVAPQSPQIEETAFPHSQVHKYKPGQLIRCNRRSKKAKVKQWGHVNHPKPPPAVVPPNVPLQPDLEDVEGMLFVSFVAKEALNVCDENVKEGNHLPPPSPPLNQSDVHEAHDVSLPVEEQIARLEKILLFHIKQQKHRQVIHPCLQDVGIKLSLLDPTLPIDLQYLGVHLPLPPPGQVGKDEGNIVNPSSSPDEAGFFVSRTGKTNDPTKIKGWREKFKTNVEHSAPDGLKNSSAFCSEMLDAYLENEAQQISDRVAVFSKCSASSVSYQLPSKSSSYVVTLDSLLKNRSVSSNGKQTKLILPKSPLRSSLSPVVPLSSSGLQHGLQRNREMGKELAHSFQEPQKAGSTVQTRSAMSIVSGPGIKKNRGKLQLRSKSSKRRAGCVSRVHNTMISAKVKNLMMLLDKEEEAVSQGKGRTYITAKRANFALSSLLDFTKRSKRPKFHVQYKDENACPEEFCRLGCICDSLEKESRGATHCRRVKCMFDCTCFKHKVLLHPSNKTTNVQRGRKRSALAFSIAEPEREPTPPAAPSVTTLWNKTGGEYDPEPLFVPLSLISFKPVSCTSLTQFKSQARVEEKDPVYLYFESRMTCARVREYNSHPPPEIHILPSKKDRTEPEQLNEMVKNGEPHPSPKISDEPKPTKLVEILSECNWEPHRSLLLSTLFERMNRNLLSEPFCLDMYKIQHVSTTVKELDTSTVITYKVCISRANEKDVTDNLTAQVKKTVRDQCLKGSKTKVSKIIGAQAQKATADAASGQKSSTLVMDQPKKPPCKNLLMGLPFKHADVGVLKAERKEPGNPNHNPITVNGKTYTKAKLHLLGQVGALNPVTRFAAFVTGRLMPVYLNQHKNQTEGKIACRPKAPLEPSSVTEVANDSNHDGARPALGTMPELSTAFKNRKRNPSASTAPSKKFVGPDTGLIMPDGSKLAVLPVTLPKSTAAPSTETVTSSLLPPGQQVVLQPAQGASGLNYLCNFNGQMIQLKPINTGSLIQTEPSSSSGVSTSENMQTASNTSLPKVTMSTWKSSCLKTPLLKPLQTIAPKGISLSAKSGINIVNGLPAFNLQSSFLGKAGTFCFRICPPSSKETAEGSEQADKPPKPSESSSTLPLPGGFTLIKLFPPAVPAVRTNSTSSPLHTPRIPQNDESMMKPVSENCSSSLEKNCQVSESINSPLPPETSNSAQGCTADLSQSSSEFPSDVVFKDESMEHSSEAVNTVTPGKDAWRPKGAEMVHISNVSESESKDMDDWPPSGAERVLWVNSPDEIESEDLDKEPSKNLDVAAGSQRNRDKIKENCPSVLIKSEQYTEPTETYMAWNEPDLKNQCLLPENNREQQLGSANSFGVSIKLESCSYSPKTDTHAVNIPKQHITSDNLLPLIPKEEPFMSQTETEFSSDPSKQDLGSEIAFQILTDKELFNEPLKPSTAASLHTEDSDEDIDIDGIAPNSLLDVQTPVAYSPPSEHLLNTLSVGQKFGIKAISPFPQDAAEKNPELLDDLVNLSDSCPKTAERLKQDFKDKVEERIKQLVPKTAVEELCDIDDEITVNVENFSEKEHENPSEESDSDENNSTDDEMHLNGDEEDSSIDIITDSETTEDSADMSKEGDVDVESFDSSDGKRVLKNLKDKARNKKIAMRLTKLKKMHVTDDIDTAGYIRELEKRINHNEKERARRNEMNRSFSALKNTLNFEENNVSRHDILNQARILILALEDRSRLLEKTKKALLQRQSAYLKRIKAKGRAGFEETSKQQKQIGSQKTPQTSVSDPLANPRRLDSDGNRLPPRLGCWKSPNYVRKRHRKVLPEPSNTTEEQSLPKIVLQSFGNIDIIKLTHDASTSLPSSTEVLSSAEQFMDGNFDLQGQNEKTEMCDTGVSNERENTLFSEHVTKESPCPSSAVTESNVLNDNLSDLIKEEQATEALVKVRKKRGRTKVLMVEGISSPDVFGPRQLRQSSAAVNGGATRRVSRINRRRIV